MRCGERLRAWAAACAAALAALAAVLAPASAPAAADPASALGLLRSTPARAARDFRVPTTTDAVLRLGDLKGKVVFLNFWATWCKPCEEEMPGIERLHRKFKDRGLAVVAISMDADGGPVVRRFVAKHQLTFPVGLDPRMSVSGPYGVWALPATVILDREGRQVLLAQGPREWDGSASESLFASLLR
jgi:cytochrome c biogenesis protein CcmG, thiol:disulfide interchange protein DsbE